MSDHKGKGATESPAGFDSESTVELDLSKLGLVTSTPTDELSFDDDTTIDSLMDIYDHLKKEGAPASEPGSHEQGFSSETIGFDKPNADIEGPLEPAGEADENLLGDEYMPEMAEKREESDDMFDLDSSDLPDEDVEEENEFNIRNPAPATDELPSLESRDDEELQPVIELTEEMLHEPESEDDQAVKDMADDLSAPELSTRENDLLSEAVNEFSKKNATIDNSGMNSAEIPELTTTESNITSAAAGDTDEEEEIPEIEVEAVAPPQSEMVAVEAVKEPVAQPGAESGNGRSNTVPLLFGILGIAAGGFGAWMAFDATGKVGDLERRIQNLSATANASQKRGITDIQQRLDKIERRLTGTPTLEAAAPLEALSAVQTAPEEAVKEPVSQSAPITPQTPTSSGSSNGDWVVNISSHAKEELATRENARLQSLGLNSEIHTARVRDRTWYRIQVTGFASKDEAKEKLKDLQQHPGIKDAWIGKR